MAPRPSGPTAAQLDTTRRRVGVGVEGQLLPGEVSAAEKNSWVGVLRGRGPRLAQAVRPARTSKVQEYAPKQQDCRQQHAAGLSPRQLASGQRARSRRSTGEGPDVTETKSPTVYTG